MHMGRVKPRPVRCMLPNMTTSPLPARINSPWSHALRWMEEGESVALATVIATGGRSPRPVGSVMVMAGNGRVEGSVSGGCVEADVMSNAREIMMGDAPRVLTYGSAEMGLWSVGLACGGRLDVLVEAVQSSSAPHGTFPMDFVRHIVTATGQGRPAILGCALDGTGHILLERENDLLVSGAVPENLSAMLQENGSARVIAGTPEWFVQTVRPSPRLLIVGAVHIAQCLSDIAARSGYDVTIIDPRAGLATPERFPGVRLMCDWPDEALAELAPDASTAIVALTHDRKLDDPALCEAVKGYAFYIGALGSRGTHAKRLSRLRDEGVEDAALARIRGPVGLPIGAIEAEEIAVSIMADIVAVRRGAPLAQGVTWWSPQQQVGA